MRFQLFLIVLLLGTAQLFLSCTESSINEYSSLKPGEVAAASISSISTKANYYDISSQLESNSSLTTLSDSLSFSNSLTVNSGSSFPTVINNSLYGKNLSFTQNLNQGLYASGVLPNELYSAFTMSATFIFSSSSGTVFAYGSDDTSDLAKVTLNGATLTLTHQSTTGNSRSRSYDITLYLNQPQIFAFAFGNEGKDIELYINGFRQTTYSSNSTGGISVYNSVQRHLTIGGTNTATFNIFDFSLVGEKLGPQPVYQISKYLAQLKSLAIAETVNKEIRLNTIPSIEPETINYSFIASSILNSKCTGCHQSGGTTPYLNSYSNIINATTPYGALVVSGSATTSRLYIRVNQASDYMPSGGASHLSDSEVQYIKSWIDSGLAE